MLTFNTPQLRKLVKDSDPSNPALNAVDEIDFLEFNQLEQSVKDDVTYLKENPLVLAETTVTGWVYEVGTGKVRSFLRFSFSFISNFVAWSISNLFFIDPSGGINWDSGYAFLYHQSKLLA